MACRVAICPTSSSFSFFSPPVYFSSSTSFLFLQLPAALPQTARLPRTCQYKFTSQVGNYLVKGPGKGAAAEWRLKCIFNHAIWCVSGCRTRHGGDTVQALTGIQASNQAGAGGVSLFLLHGARDQVFSRWWVLQWCVCVALNKRTRSQRNIRYEKCGSRLQGKMYVMEWLYGVNTNISPAGKSRADGLQGGARQHDTPSPGSLIRNTALPPFSTFTVNADQSP